MARSPNKWIDPAGVLATYNWPVNHAEEQPVAKSRQMGDGASTDDIGLVPQQGPATPLVFTIKGRFFDDNQHAQNLAFWALCNAHSIYWQKFNGDKYEVLITDYDADQVRASRNPRFPDKSYIWEFTMTMRVLKALSGPYVGVP